jgi:hypothetical protein
LILVGSDGAVVEIFSAEVGEETEEGPVDLLSLLKNC